MDVFWQLYIVNHLVTFRGRESLFAYFNNFNAIPTASRTNGTGMRAAADCNTTKVCFPMAMKYCESVGMTPPGVFRRFLESNVRQREDSI